MSRVIKFRSWDKTNKCYTDHNIFLGMDGWIMDATIDDGRDDLAIEQYTGLQDKNGVDIYEGDIVENGYGRRCVLWWSTMGMEFLAVWADEYQSILNKDPMSAGGNPCGVDKLEGIGSRKPYLAIGNIHQNPELLEATS